MALNFSKFVYDPCFAVFSRPIIVTPQGGQSYSARGVYDTDELEIVSPESMSVIADQKTFVDILDADFIAAGYAIPRQGDLIEIPADVDLDAEGLFEVVDVSNNGGGETHLVIREYGSSAP
jgi:hypothetical protein